MYRGIEEKIMNIRNIIKDNELQSLFTEEILE